MWLVKVVVVVGIAQGWKVGVKGGDKRRMQLKGRLFVRVLARSKWQRTNVMAPLTKARRVRSAAASIRRWMNEGRSMGIREEGTDAVIY